MERVIAGVLAVLLFCAVLWMGLARGLPTETVMWRSLICAVAGFLVGWISFGPLGKALMQGSTRITEESETEETPPEATEQAEKPAQT